MHALQPTDEKDHGVAGVGEQGALEFKESYVPEVCCNFGQQPGRQSWQPWSPIRLAAEHWRFLLLLDGTDEACALFYQDRKWDLDHDQCNGCISPASAATGYSSLKRQPELGSNPTASQVQDWPFHV
jgi:hypothetical protein